MCGETARRPEGRRLVVQHVRADGADGLGKRLVVQHVRADGAAAWGQAARCAACAGRRRYGLRRSTWHPSGVYCRQAGAVLARVHGQSLIPRSSGSDQVNCWRPRQDSNLRSRLRRAVLYPLSYGGPASGPRRTVSVVGGPSRTLDVPEAPVDASGHGQVALRLDVAGKSRPVGGYAGDCVRMSPGSQVRSAGPAKPAPRSRPSQPAPPSQPVPSRTPSQPCPAAPGPGAGLIRPGVSTL